MGRSVRGKISFERKTKELGVARKIPRGGTCWAKSRAEGMAWRKGEGGGKRAKLRNRLAAGGG